MSRDRGDGADAPRAGAPEPERPDREGDHRRERGAPERRGCDDRQEIELLAAYVDGVTELSHDERKRVEGRIAGDAGARTDEAQVRELLGRLRDLPPEGNEPDWTAMERSIRAAVGDEVPRPWWRAWRWLVPLTSCATAAAVMLLLWSRPGGLAEQAMPVMPTVPTAPFTAGSRPPVSPPSERGDDPAAIVPLWLDGAEVDVDLTAAEILRGPELGEYDPSQADADDDGALLPAAGLSWVDRLDDDAIARAERWLASSAATSPGGSGDGAPRRKKS